MALIEFNKNPSRRELAWFGALLALFSGVVGGLLWIKTGSLQAAAILWAFAASVIALYSIFADLRRPLYLAWMYATLPIGWTVSYLLLAILFYLVMTPIGLVMRLLGRDPLQRRFDRSTQRYWTEHDSSSHTARYLRQF